MGLIPDLGSLDRRLEKSQETMEAILQELKKANRFLEILAHKSPVV